MVDIKGTSKNRPFPQWRRQPRAQILMYSPIHSGFPRALPCPHKKTWFLKVPLRESLFLLTRYPSMASIP